MHWTLLLPTQYQYEEPPVQLGILMYDTVNITLKNITSTRNYLKGVFMVRLNSTVNYKIVDVDSALVDFYNVSSWHIETYIPKHSEKIEEINFDFLKHHCRLNILRLNGYLEEARAGLCWLQTIERLEKNMVVVMQ